MAERDAGLQIYVYQLYSNTSLALPFVYNKLSLANNFCSLSSAECILSLSFLFFSAFYCCRFLELFTCNTFRFNKYTVVTQIH